MATKTLTNQQTTFAADSNADVTVSTNTGNSDDNTQRVVLASDQPVVSIDDNGGSLTVDGTVAVSGTVTVDGSGSTQPVSGTVSANITSSLSASNVGVTTGSTSIVSADSTRRILKVVNVDTSKTVYINGGTATTSHFPLRPGESISLNGFTGALNGIGTAGTTNLRVLEG